MFLGETRRNPDDRYGFKARRISHELPEMAMVSALAAMDGSAPSMRRKRCPAPTFLTLR